MIRAVTIKTNAELEIVKVCFFYDGTISDEDFELASCAITEIISDFPPAYQLDQQIQQLDSPQKNPR